MKRNKEDFFEQMHNYGTTFDKKQNIVLVVGASFIVVLYILLILEATKTIAFTRPIIITLIVFLVLSLVIAIYYSALYFTRNHRLFIKGKLSAGILNLASIILLLFLILFILYMSLPEHRNIFKSTFTYIATITTAALTMMGVYYTLTKHRNESDDKLNLIFRLSNNNEKLINELFVKNAVGDITINLNLENISNNFGYLVGLYRICGCDVYQIGDSLPYFPLQPQSIASISNIKMNFGDDQLIIVYKDIRKNYYYLLLSSNYQFIEDAGKCDIDFLSWRLYMTDKSAKKFKSKSTLKTFKATIADENYINQQKENTKPINTIRENGFDLILSPNGTMLTDKDLLNKLKKERSKLAKTQQVKAYMIFNNQQLVAMATFKPCDELSFISIYGLGKKKYELYGNLFLPIIAEHQYSEKKSA